MFNHRRSKRGVEKMELNILNMISNMKVKQEQQKYNLSVKNVSKNEDLTIKPLIINSLGKSKSILKDKNNVFITT